MENRKESISQMSAECARLNIPDFTNPVIAARAWADEREKRQVAEKQRYEAVKEAVKWKSIYESSLRKNFDDESDIYVWNYS